jgi:hypothetical protein
MKYASGFIEYPASLEALQAELGPDYPQAIAVEAMAAYKLYYFAARSKPQALSEARRQCDRMINAAHKVLNTLDAMKPPVTPFYEHWMYRNGEAGKLKSALQTHVQALHWAERQMKAAGNPEQQTGAGARQFFIDRLREIFERHDPDGSRDEHSGAIRDTLDLLKIKAPTRL